MRTYYCKKQFNLNVFMLSRLYGILLPFFVSFLLAWLLDPLVTFIQYKCRVKFRALSVAITLIPFVGLLYLIFLLISFPSIRANWRRYVPAKYLPQVSTLAHELTFRNVINNK